MAETPSSEPLKLPRGGVAFSTAAGWLQYGAVPETIKDTMILPGGVPALFVAPPRLFDAGRGISLAELEFPAYFNFFIKGRRTTMICRPEQRPVLEAVLSQALFGPEVLDEAEFASGPASRHVDMKAELAYFRRNPKKGGQPMVMEDLVEFVEFNSSGIARLAEGVAVVAEDDGGISVLENFKVRGRWHGEPPLPGFKPPPPGPLKAFWTPALGVSVIGSGHGFDPGNRTSGFIVWIDGHGVLIDPPVDSVEWLAGYDIAAKQVDTLILTHCHADHDAGTLQKILQEGRITIYTTPTVLSGFVGKYAALTAMTPEKFRGLFDFVPVRTGEPIFLHGAQATFRYSLHALPCAGFEIKLRNRSLVYPSDTLNEPKAIARLHEEGIISRERRDELLAFPWHHDLVLHEAGIPPIHTPIEYLSTLSDEIKSRTLLVHVSQKSLPAGSGLRIAPTGLENTLDLGAAHLEVGNALEILDAMARVEIFTDLSADRAAEFLRMVRKEAFAPGDTILRKGDPGDRFYIILSGHAAVWKEGSEFKVYGPFDYLGETALLLGQPRVADVLAKTEVSVLVLHRADFLHLIRGSDLADRLIKLAKLRAMPSWELLAVSPILATLSASQKTQLQILMEPVEIAAGTFLKSDNLLLAEGDVDVRAGGRPAGSVSRGGFVGDAEAVSGGTPPRYEFEARTALKGFRFEQDGLARFFRDNPGAYMQLAALGSVWDASAQAIESDYQRGADKGQ